MTCKLKIKIEQGAIDGRTMLVELMAGSEKTSFNESIEKDIKLPCSVSLLFSGKNNATDTIVDQDNNIVADMYTKILSIELDGISIPEVYIQKYLGIDTGEQKIYSSYIGFNGKMTLEFQESTLFQEINRIRHLT